MVIKRDPRLLEEELKLLAASFRKKARRARHAGLTFKADKLDESADRYERLARRAARVPPADGEK